MSSSTLQIRIPPHSEDAEISVLGALLMDRDAIIAVAELLNAANFYDERHAEIYESIIQLYEQRVPIDVLTVSEVLRKRKVLKKIGGTAYLADLVNKVPTAAHVEHYAKIVKDQATKRSLMSAASKLVELSMDEGLEAGELLDKAESEVFSLTQRHLSQSFTPIKAALADSFDRLDELHKQEDGLRGVPTGFRDLDNLLAGMQRSNLIILAARPGVGKTTLAMNIAQHVSVDLKRPVGIFSLEMSKEELVDRLLVGQADIDAWKLKTGKLSDDDFTALSNAMGELAESPIYIDDTPGQSILEMRTKARRLQVEFGIDLLIVDYLQLAKSRNLENRVQEVSEVSQGMKNIARELKIPVLCLSQLSRAVEQRGTKRPQLADLRDSGCLTGDTLITLYDSGKQVRIDSLVGKKNIDILSIDSDLKVRKAKVSKVFYSGIKETFELRLRSGKNIKASANHKFLTIDGWKRLDELAVGDIVATPRFITTSAHVEVIPKQSWLDIRSSAQLAGFTDRVFHAQMGWAYSGTQRYKNGISRERLLRINTVINNQKLDNLAHSDLFWDQISSITPLGKDKVYDATVPGFANFIANDIVVHNSIEQDADVVMFLWREDDDSRETIGLDIAKHRNGPLGSVQFYFKGDRISFYGMEKKHGS